MQRTDSIFFISGQQICGRLSQAQVTRNEIGEILVYDFNILADKRNRTNASQYKKRAVG